VIQDPPEVGALSGGAKFEPLSARLPGGVRFLRHPLPPRASVTLASHVPRSLWVRWGLPRSARSPLLRGLGSVFPPAAQCQRGAISQRPDRTAYHFGSCLSALLACHQ